MTGTWTIEAKAFVIEAPGLGLPLGKHMYLEIWDNNGNRVTQLNGLATNIATGKIEPIGQPATHYIKSYSTPYFELNKTQSTSTAPGTVLFTGTQEQVMTALNAALIAERWINQQNFLYEKTATNFYDATHFNTPTYNSNSVFSAYIKAFSAVDINISQSLIDDAVSQGGGSFFGAPGIDKDILKNDNWIAAGGEGDTDLGYPISIQDLLDLMSASPFNAIYALDVAQYIDEDGMLLDGGTNLDGSEYVIFARADGAIVIVTGDEVNSVFQLISKVEVYSSPDTDAVVTRTYDEFDANNDPVGEPQMELEWKNEIIVGEQLGNIFALLAANDNVPDTKWNSTKINSHNARVA